MKYETLYNSFLQEISQKIPQKTDVVNVLADMLCIGKESVYRRLRGEAPFTFQEAMTISKRLDISLDSIKMGNSSISKPFKLNLIEYINPAESDFALMEEMTEVMKTFDDSANAEAGEITNLLPQPLYVGYEHIFKFYLFKWKYHSGGSNKTLPYKDIVVLDKLRKTQHEYVEWAKRLNADYIFDRQIFYYLVNSVRYFYEIGMIEDQDARLIQQDMFRILDQIDLLSRTGVFKETGKRVRIYISDINVDTNYIYVSAPGYHLIIIKVFMLNGIASSDKKTYEELMNWFFSMRRQSVLITDSGEKERIKFLETQHQTIEGLLK